MKPLFQTLRALFQRKARTGLKVYDRTGKVVYDDTNWPPHRAVDTNVLDIKLTDPAALTQPPGHPFQGSQEPLMSHAYLSLSQAAAIRQARQGSDADRKAIKKEVFAAVREGYGIPANIKFTVEVDPSQPGFRLLKDKVTRQPIQLNGGGTYGDQAAAAPAKVWVRVPKDDVLTAIRGYVKDIDVDGDDVFDGVPDSSDATVVDGLRVGDDGIYVEMARDDLSID
jgi:hypothetical protein